MLSEGIVMRRILPLFVLALLAFIVSPALADTKDTATDTKKKSHTGRVVSVEGTKLVMEDSKGGKKHTHTISADAKITCDGKECKLSDLKEGTHIKVTMEEGKVVAIAARTKTGDKDKKDAGGKDKKTDK